MSKRPILFAVVLCVVCSVLLTAASSVLKKRQLANIAFDRQTNLLESIGLISSGKSRDRNDINRLYAENIKRVYVNQSGEITPDAGEKSLPLYLYQKDGKTDAYIIPINTRGLWGKINGYLALEADGATIAGFSVYRHQETPGLGGEIEKKWFGDNFIGKKIVNKAGGFVSISIARGDAEKIMTKDKRANFVDGISGATLTGRFLTKGLRDVLLVYEPVSVRFRNNAESKR